MSFHSRPWVEVGGLAIVAFFLVSAGLVPLALVDHAGTDPHSLRTASRDNVGPTALLVDAAADPSQAEVGETITFTCEAFGGTPPGRYEWTFGDGENDSGSTVTHAYSTAGTFTAECEVTALFDVGSDEVDVEITEPGQPPLSVTASVDRTQATPGEILTFTATASGGDGSYSFGWEFGDGDSGSGEEITHAYSNKGEYPATVTVTDGNSDSDSDSVTVTITNRPEPLETTASASRPAADVDQSITFTCAASGGSSPYSYEWTFGDGGTGSGSTASHAYATPGTKTATCTVTDAQPALKSATIDVDVSPRPTVTAHVDHPEAAPNTTLTFTAQAEGGPGSFSDYSWTFGDGTSRTGPVVSHAYADVGGYQATVVVTDGNGVAASDLVSVTISKILVTASVAPSEGTTDTLFAFTAEATGGGGAPYTYTWDFGDGTPPVEGSTVSHTYATQGSYTPSVVAKDTLLASEPKSLATISVTPASVPGGPLTTTMHFSPTSPTVNQTVYLNARPSGGSGGYRCSWDFGDRGVSSTCGTSHAWAVAGSYLVAVTVSDSAGSSTTKNSTIEVQAASLPPKPLRVTVFLSPRYPLVDETVFLYAKAEGGAGPYTCAWDFGDGTHKTACGTSHTWKGAGSYTVTVAVSDSEGNLTSETLSVRIEGTPAPGTPLSVTIFMMPSSPMVNESVFFGGVARGGSGEYLCSWDFGDGNLAGGCAVSHAFAVNGTYDVTVSVSDSGGDRASTALSAQVIAPLSARIELGPAIPILGEPTALVAHPFGGTGPYECAWDYGDSGRGTGCATSHTWRSRGTYDIWLFVNDSAGRHSAVLKQVTVEASGLFGLSMGVDLVVVALPLTVAGALFFAWKRRRDQIRSQAQSDSLKVENR